MLGDYKASPVLAVKDLAAGKGFYGGVLGLKLAKEDEYEVYYETANGTLEIYVSSYAGTNQATAATWEVKAIETVVEELKGKGVVFEQYDMPGVTRDGDVHDTGGMKAAWFKDPDGNILCLHEET